MTQKIKLTYKPAPTPTQRRRVRVTYKPSPRAMERKRAEQADLEQYRRALDLFFELVPQYRMKAYEDDPSLCQEDFLEFLSDEFPQQIREAVKRVL